MVFSFSLDGLLINYLIVAPTMSKMLSYQRWLIGFISCVISDHLAMAINVLRRILRLSLGTEPSSISCLLLGLVVCTHSATSTFPVRGTRGQSKMNKVPYENILPSRFSSFPPPAVSFLFLPIEERTIYLIDEFMRSNLSS